MPAACNKNARKILAVQNVDKMIQKAYAKYCTMVEQRDKVVEIVKEAI